MTFMPVRAVVLSVAILLPFVLSAAGAEDNSSSDHTAKSWVGPGVLLHSNEKHQRCNLKRFELFSCALRSGGFAALCLSPIDLHTTKFELQNKKSNERAESFDDLEVGSQGGNAHAYNVIFRGHNDSAVTTVFVSEGTYDGESGTITRTSQGRQSVFECVAQKIYVPALLVKDRSGHESRVNKDSLIRQGIAKRLINLPNWPEIQDESVPQNPK